jgi:hypothetical protein
MADLAELLQRYGYGQQDPGPDETFDTRNVLDTMQKRAPTLLNRLAGAIPQNTGIPSETTYGPFGEEYKVDYVPKGPSLAGILQGGLDTAGRWLGGNPEVGRDTLAPLGLAAIGRAPAGALVSGAMRRAPNTPDVQTVRGFHGSPKEFSEFNADTIPWLSSHQSTARSFAVDRGSGSMYPQEVTRALAAGKIKPVVKEWEVTGRILENDPWQEAKHIAKQIGETEPSTWDEVANLLNWGGDYQHQIIDEARRAGYDAVRFKNVADDPRGLSSDHIAVLNHAAAKLLGE